MTRSASAKSFLALHLFFNEWRIPTRFTGYLFIKYNFKTFFLILPLWINDFCHVPAALHSNREREKGAMNSATLPDCSLSLLWTCIFHIFDVFPVHNVVASLSHSPVVKRGPSLCVNPSLHCSSPCWVWAVKGSRPRVNKMPAAAVLLLLLVVAVSQTRFPTCCFTRSSHGVDSLSLLFQ